MAKAIETVLRVEGEVSARLEQALRAAKPLAALLEALGERIHPKKPPAWLVFTGTGALDEVVHLGSPLFHASGADEDVFDAEPGSPQIVFGKKGVCRLVDGSEDPGTVKLSAKELKRVTAFDVGGFLLASIQWFEDPPESFAKCEKLLERAAEAYQGNLPAYELEAADEPADASSTASGEAAVATFLGGPARSGCFAAAVKRSTPSVRWSAISKANRGNEWGGNPVASEGVVYAGGGGFNAECSATSADGGLLWTQPMTTGQSWVVGSPCAHLGVVYQALNQGVQARDAKSGELKWFAKLPKPKGNPIVIGDQLFVGSGDGLVSIALATGRKKLRFAVKKNEYKEGVIGGLTYADGIFYFTGDGKLFAVQLASGAADWSVPADQESAPSLDQELVYTWHDSAAIAVERSSGQVRWRTSLPGRNAHSSFAVAADRVVTRADGVWVALGKRDGKVLWQRGLDEPYGIGKANPVIGGDVVVGVLVSKKNRNERALAGVDLENGELLWRLSEFPFNETTKADLSWDATPWIDQNGTIYVQANGLHAVR